MSRSRLKPLAPKSKKLYDRVLHRAFGDAAPQSAPDVEGWPESTRVPLRAAIVRYWDARGRRSYGEEVAAAVPAARALKRRKVRPSPADESAFEKRLKKEEPRVRSLMRIGLGLGLRTEELLTMPRGLFEGAVRWGKLTVTGKGFKERVLDASGVKEAVEELLTVPACQPHAKRDHGTERRWTVPGHVLAAPESSFETQRNMLARHIKLVAERAGLNPAVWSPHTLRHVFATRMFRDGAPLQVIQEALGHESIETTIKYIGITPEDVAKYMRRIR